ncbi:alpha/beta fold hydrolase [Mucilaginibacter sabulilitoris]|uniref:Alpha/beta fold hydrolase n=1 Tax=Mucilaginibacter sabulilitoris TaxID=1173583 RepID=A0ABZ0TSQ0_9SPHI|nr:alpha/beta fold hydrolase [Mucilaginibacter sabulilitoris]WPU94789.1 alpha/beta fold hydrolase [Mucilaginibacter sabulilitoris]
MKSQTVKHLKTKVLNLNIFYRESGAKDAPVILLLHGYPTSSHMYRNLIPLLSDRFRVIAPDLPGFGYSDAPKNTEFNYTFDNLAQYMQAFIDQLGIKRFAMQVFDYGAPVGYRLALANPEKITGIISQNGNAYEEGLSDGWNPIQKYWADPSEQNRNNLRAMTTLETTKWQYLTGVGDETLVAPESFTLDQYFLEREGSVEIQLDLFKDYASNVAMYPAFHQYFKKYQPPFLAVWGDKDPFFLPPGAEAFKRDLPDATVKFYDTGHFALETHVNEIGEEILTFLNKLPA